MKLLAHFEIWWMPYRYPASPPIYAGAQHGGTMADLYSKSLESERKSLWATCRLKGLAKDTPERQRIAAIDTLLREHKEKPRGNKPA
jgi:hypothetical protein